MRPRKVILCVDEDEQALSVRRFFLETRGYRVLTAESVQQSLEILERSAPGTVDLMLAELVRPKAMGDQLAVRAKRLHPFLPCLITSAAGMSWSGDLMADGFLPTGPQAQSELLERVRLMVKRKRGPRKQGSVRSAMWAPQEVVA